MFRKFFRNRKVHRLNQNIDPDEIFLDSENLPEYDKYQLEGRIEKPIRERSVAILGIVGFLIIGLFISKVWTLQIKEGESFKNISENNRLRHTLVFSDRGNIYDRNGEPLAWNIPKTEDGEYNLRKYTESPGFSNLLGYIKYPQKDKAGFYYEEDFIGFSGIEAFYGDKIKGTNGLRIVETDAIQKEISNNTIRPPESGESITLTIDKRIQEELHNSIKGVVDDVGFVGGGGVIMDVTNGEVIALTTYPEFDSNILTDGKDRSEINSFVEDEANPFLNRVISGLYTPASIVKPYMALAALQEGVISPTTNIVSRGQIEIPNPYNPDNPSIFTDWKAHGPVDIRKALAYSSNIYFYEIGGGFKEQEGIGILNIEKYMKLFGFGSEVNGRLFEGEKGLIPNPEWKEKTFDGDPWRLGDTYFTSIGQYGFQVTPLQVIRAVSAIANKGTLINPIIVKGENAEVVRKITEIDQKYFDVVQAGMRDAVLFGTAGGLNISSVDIAAKTGTAELGVSKAKVNSWVTGFFPYNKPKYAFVVVMERGGRKNLIGGVAVARRLFDWMSINTPEYFEE